MPLPLQRGIELASPADELGPAGLDVLFSPATWATNLSPPPRGSHSARHDQRHNDPDLTRHRPEQKESHAAAAFDSAIAAATIPHTTAYATRPIRNTFDAFAMTAILTRLAL